jgi:hypothetical protein
MGARTNRALELTAMSCPRACRVLLVRPTDRDVITFAMKPLQSNVMATAQDPEFLDDDPTDEFPVLFEAVLAETDLDATAQFSASSPPLAASERPPRHAAEAELHAERAAPVNQAEAQAASDSAWRETLALREAEQKSLESQLDARENELVALRVERDSLRVELEQAGGRIEALTAAQSATALHDPITNVPPPTLSPSAGRDLRAAREEIAALADYIALRHQRWNETLAALAEARSRIGELELEVAQRMSREHAAARRAEAAIERSRELGARLASLLEAAPDGDRGSTRRSKIVTASRHDADSPQPARGAGVEMVQVQAWGAHAKPANNSGAAPQFPRSTAAAARLVCLTSEPPRSYALERETITIGRSSRCDIKLATHFVSREHAGLVAAAEQWIVEDLGSKNGVFVNAVRVQSQALHDGDLVTIGDAQFRFDQDAGASGPPGGIGRSLR